MSTYPNPNSDHGGPAGPQTIRVVSHTPLIYWWPVWLVGFIMAALTYADDSRLAVLPAGTTVTQVQPGKVYELTVTNGQAEALEKAAARGQDAFPVRIARSKDLGALYVVVVLLVIVGSTVPLRGLASVIAILTIL